MHLLSQVHFSFTQILIQNSVLPKIKALVVGGLFFIVGEYLDSFFKLHPFGSYTVINFSSGKRHFPYPYNLTKEVIGNKQFIKHIFIY